MSAFPQALAAAYFKIVSIGKALGWSIFILIYSFWALKMKKTPLTWSKHVCALSHAYVYNQTLQKQRMLGEALKLRGKQQIASERCLSCICLQQKKKTHLFWF